MRIIYCNIQMFSNDQMIYVIDETNGKPIHAIKADINDLPKTICALAGKYETNIVKCAGNKQFVLNCAEEIKTVYAMNYFKNDIKVEVI